MDTSPQPSAPKSGDPEETPRPQRGLLPWLRRRRWFVVVSGLMLLIALGSWLLAAPNVHVVGLRRGPAIESVYASGVVDYVRQARISPVVNAAIRAVRVREGDNVRQGQILVDLVAGQEEATALQLEAQAAQARSTYDRTNQLFRRGFAAPAAHDDALREYQAAAAAARAAEERLRDFHIAAPFAGRVLRRDGEPGNMAQIGTPLIIIADVNSLRITADIDERDAGRIAPGQQALAQSDAFPGQQFPARVSEFTPQGDATARVFRARLSIDPHAALRPGMTVELNIVLSRRDNAILAPTRALRDHLVWVLAGGAAHRRTVVVGVEDPQQVEIRSGLQGEEQVIVDPPTNLRDGAAVQAHAGQF